MKLPYVKSLCLRVHVWNSWPISTELGINGMQSKATQKTLFLISLNK